MNYYFPIFGLFIIFIIWFTYERKKASRLERQAKEDFWQKEAAANNVRRVPLDSLTYVKVEDSILLSSLSAKDCNDAVLLKCNDTLLELKEKRMFNLTGMTSTDIKLTYGPANLNALDEYDTNYTLFVKTLYEFGSRLNELGFKEDAIRILEFGIDSLTDISGNYKLLADLYIEKNQPEKLGHLMETCEKLNSLNKKSIKKYLDDAKSTSSSIL